MSKQKKMWLIGGVCVLMVGLALTFVMKAFNDNLVFFYSPTQVVNQEVPLNRTFRMGGFVKEGSLKRLADGVTVEFEITDTAKTVRAQYRGILPDLFKEGKGAVAQGKMNEEGLFVASEVLAKHDENYMPPEAADAVKKAHEAAKTLKQPA